VDLLGEEDARLFSAAYDVTARGNWEGHNILNRPQPFEQVAARLEIDPEELNEKLAAARQTLMQARSQRIAPGRDDKVLAAWNGLMITAFAQAGRILQEDRYTTAAVEAARFVLQEMRDEHGRFLHSYKDGRARFNAYLDDYACLIEAFAELYQTTFAAEFLDAALETAHIMIDQFHDADEGGFFYTSHDHEELITRQKDQQDTATHSGNSMAATALLKLARLCGRRDLEEIALGTLRMQSGLMAKHPTAAGQALIALDFLYGPTHEFVLVDGSETTAGDAALRDLDSQFFPNKIVVRVSESNAQPTALQELLQGKEPIDGQTTLYVCEQGVCGKPAAGTAEIAAELHRLVK